LIDKDWKLVGYHEVRDTPDYHCGMDEYRRGKDQMMFIHFTFHNFTKKTLKQALAEFKLLRECVTCPLYACADHDDDKWRAFVKLFGFKPLIVGKCTDGKQRNIYIHIKEEPNNGRRLTDNPTVLGQRTVERTAAVPEASIQRRTDGTRQSAASASPN
jgi:hypothetical protein